MHYRSYWKNGVLAATLLLAITPPSGAQQPPEATLQALEPAKGLEVSLFAAEDDLVNPTAMDIDAHGRVWVTEAANYRLFKHEVVRDQGDRVRVLEDTNGDGRCNKATTFYQDPSVQAPLGIAVVGQRVYICQSPELYYLEDTDGDLKADKKTVILDGFGGVDHDHAVHGVMIGPDGLLYLTVGDGGLDVTDQSGNRVTAGKAVEDADHDAATVLRVDLDGNRLEVLAEGMRNPYAPAVSSFGTVYASDNDDDGNEQCQINYVMEGGHYGYWPRRQGDRRLDAIHWNKDRPGVMPNMIRTGFGSPTGLLFYEGTSLPERLHNTLIHAEAGPGEIRSYRPTADGAGYSGDTEVILSAPGDEWFRPSDVCVAPDGSILVADWYDPGVGGHNMGDTTRGRIYRLAAKDTTYRVPPLDLKTEEGLTEAFTSPNLARRYLAWSILNGELKSPEVPLLHRLYEDERPAIRARALWLLGREERHGLETLLDAARSDAAGFRILAIRLLADRGPDALYSADWLLDDPSPRVRRQLLVELQGFPESATRDRWLIALALQYDGHDRFYREAIGLAFAGREQWGYEKLKEALNGRWDERLAGLALQLHPPEALALAEEALSNEMLGMTPRLAALDVIDAIGTEQAGALLVAQVTDPAAPELYNRALHHLARNAGHDWRHAAEDDALDEALAAALADPDRSDAAWQFVTDTGRESLAPMLASKATDGDLSSGARLEALDALAGIAPKIAPKRANELVEQIAVLVRGGDEQFHAPALKTIQAFRGPASRELLLELARDTDQPKTLRAAAARQLGHTQSGALGLLGLVEEGELPADLAPEVSDLAHASPFEDVRMMAQQLMPVERTAAGEALPPMEELVAMEGDPKRGKAIFFQEDAAQCIRCHQIGDKGIEVGPNLDTIGEKFGREGLLESILYPNAAISHEYEVWVIETAWEGLLSGFLVDEDDETVRIMDATGAVKPIKKDDIVSRRKSETSLMPSGLAAAMSAQDLSDLVAYLATLK